ncbi:MAG: glycerate kinase [Chloroflexi bacterium]|nr:glycerate kinase [Chloroflexota bacterium]
MDANRFLTHSLQDPRVTRILAAALDAVEPGRIVRDYLNNADLPEHGRTFLLGIGKAAEPMTFAAADVLTPFTDALVITKHASFPLRERITVMEGGHPIPDERSLAAGQAVLDFVSKLNENDLLICLVSGGGSALVTAPRMKIPLEEIRQLTSSLLESGATIDEINTVRRRLDYLKGGELARKTKAKIVSLILSDVIGDHLEVIASGPTAPDPTSFIDAVYILRKYNLEKTASPQILGALLLQPSIINDAIFFTRVQNIIIGNNQAAADAAKVQAEQEGFYSEIIGLEIQGEARRIGKKLAETLFAASDNQPSPFCLIAGGETTVTIKGNGKGGRNQEVALAAVDELRGIENILFISLATDGDDGPTNAAGAVVNGESYQRAKKLGMDASDYLSRNDAYNFFNPLDDLLKPGYTGTNVNDLMFLIGF